jgi:hypothetical protein
MCSGDRSVVTGYSVAIANLNVAKVVFSLSIAKAIHHDRDGAMIRLGPS